MSDPARKIRLLMELRRQGISDTAVLGAIERIPREAFVEKSFADQAYENIALPIKQGQTISQPYIVAYMTQALKPDPRVKVLEIGTGSGYQTAVLAQLFRRVYTVERFRTLAETAAERLEGMKLRNITARTADGYQGWPEQAPFARIIATAAAADIPETLVDQLDEGGILVLPVGERSDDQEILRVTKLPYDVRIERLIKVRFVPMVKGTVD